MTWSNRIERLTIDRAYACETVESQFDQRRVHTKYYKKNYSHLSIWCSACRQVSLELNVNIPWFVVEKIISYSHIHK